MPAKGNRKTKKRESTVKVTWGHFFVLLRYPPKKKRSIFSSFPNLSSEFSQQERVLGNIPFLHISSDE
jgi:hypothetical protein